MTIFVGSTNPVKVNAVTLATGDTWPGITIKGFSTKSGVSEQPLSDEETRRGAANRAVSALEQGRAQANIGEGPVLGIGLEGGVLTDTSGDMWSTVWVSLVDTQGIHLEANGARIKVPDLIANAIRAGQEMGPIMETLSGESNVRQKQGMFGIITNNFISRTEEYSAITKMALGLWYGQGWDAGLKHQVI